MMLTCAFFLNSSRGLIVRTGIRGSRSRSSSACWRRRPSSPSTNLMLNGESTTSPRTWRRPTWCVFAPLSPFPRPKVLCHVHLFHYWERIKGAKPANFPFLPWQSIGEQLVRSLRVNKYRANITWDIDGRQGIRRFFRRVLNAFRIERKR